MRSIHALLLLLVAAPLAQAFGETEWYASTTNAKAITTGGDLTCVLRTDGRAVCQSATGASSEFPETDVVQIEAGTGFACILRTTGRVRCDGPPIVPPDPYAGSDVASIEVGPHAVCAIRMDRQTACWGSIRLGALGQASAVSIGESRACVARATQLLCGHLDATSLWTVYTGSETLVDVAVGDNFVCHLDTTGRTGCISFNGGEVPFLELTDAVEIDAGPELVCALQRAGYVVCAGDPDAWWVVRPPSYYETLGLGADVSAGGDNACVLWRTGDAYCLGAVAPYVATDAIVRTSPSILVCEDSNGDGSCGPYDEPRVRVPLPLAQIDAAGVRACLDDDESGACDEGDPGASLPP